MFFNENYLTSLGNSQSAVFAQTRAQRISAHWPRLDGCYVRTKVERYPSRRNGLGQDYSDYRPPGLARLRERYSIYLVINVDCRIIFPFFLLGIWGPHLVVVPTSVMLNWEMEFKKWCPSFKILTYYGNQKDRRLKRMGMFALTFMVERAGYYIFL